LSLNSSSAAIRLSLDRSCWPLQFQVTISINSIGNITTAVFGDKDKLHVGASSMIYGVLGGLIGYIVINGRSLLIVRTQLYFMVFMLTFFAMMFSISGNLGFAGFVGGMVGGFSCTLVMLPGIRTKSWTLIGIGGGVIALYWLVMFLVFYLAV
jgi:hypothetical protein